MGTGKQMGTGIENEQMGTGIEWLLFEWNKWIEVDVVQILN